jgi:hypothetical protein
MMSFPGWGCAGCRKVSSESHSPVVHGRLPAAFLCVHGAYARTGLPGTKYEKYK